MFINEFFGKKKVETVAEGEDNCPPATQDIALNLENRKKAIDEYGYGPLNPALPNTKFWMHKVNEWNLDSADEAKQSLCGNCAAFDIRQNTLGCIAQGIDSSNPEDAASVIDAGDLGYCKFLKFKCASQRTCDAWVTGGPLTDEQGVAEGLNEFAPDGFNGGDDDEEFSPEIAKMAQEDGFTKGASLADGATLERAMTINHWHSQHSGMYKQYFAKGFKAGRMNKVNHDNKQYNLNLKLMKDGSIRHGEQGVAEAGSFSYGKPPRKGSVADLAAKKRKEQERGQQPVEPRDQRVGVARVRKDLAEGVMDQIKNIYMMLVSDTPMGTTKSEFLGHWQRIIQDELGKRIDIDTLAKLDDNFTNRYKSMSRRGDVGDWHREMGHDLGHDLEEGVAEGLGKDIKRLATGKDVKSRAGQEIAKSQDASMKGDTKTSKKHFDRYDKLDKLANKEQGVAEGAVEDLAKDLKNPHSYNAIDHMMQSIADKSNVTPKELHNQFVEKYGMTPDEWIKNEQGVEETYGAKLHTEHKRNRFKQLEKIKQQQEKALGLGEAGCNMTNEGRYCSEHGMMECPGYGMTETSVQDKLHQQHQELRKQRGLPDPSYYKKLAAQKQAEIDALRAEIAADRTKSMKESLRPGERHHYEDDPKTGKRVYKGIRGDQYDAPKKTTGHEHDADRDRAAHRAHDRSMTESIESYMEELDRAGYGLQEEKVRLDPKCWKGKKIGSPKTKVKGGVRVNNCVPK